MPNFPTLNFNDWQFVCDQTLMSHPLDAEHGAQIDVQIYAERKVRLFLVNSEHNDKLLLAEGEKINLVQSVIGFDKMEIRTSATNDYAVRLFVTDNLQSEENDGTPAVMVIDIDRDQRIDTEVQKRLILELAATGLGHDDIVDIIEGVNSNDDLEFDEDEDLPSEAEMWEIINEARQRSVLEDDEPTQPKGEENQGSVEHQNSEET